MDKKIKNNVSTQVVLEALKKKAGPLVKRLESATVSTKENYEATAAALKEYKALGKEAKAQLDSIIDPLKTAQANAKKLFEPFFARLGEIEEATKTKLLGFVEKQNRASMKVMKDFEDGKIKKVGTVLEKQAQYDVASDSASVRKLTRCRCLDAKATPREYLVPDERAILDALKSGKKVKGWELETVNSIAV